MRWRLKHIYPGEVGLDFEQLTQKQPSMNLRNLIYEAGHPSLRGLHTRINSRSVFAAVPPVTQGGLRVFGCMKSSNGDSRGVDSEHSCSNSLCAGDLSISTPAKQE